MIDLVYKVGNTSEGENYNELRYSIRSAVRHFKDLGIVYIIGTKPSWLEGIKHIELSDCYTSNKDANLINKLILTCCDSNLSDQFLNMSDDFFFLQDIDSQFFKVPIHNNNIIDFKPDHTLTKWERRLQRTIDVLKSKNLPTNCYDIHVPQLIDKQLYPKIMFNYDYGFGEGYCGNTLYFNSINEQGKSIEEHTLQRFETKLLNVNDIENAVRNKLLLNYTVSSFNSVMQSFLQNKFNEKSCYESY